MGADNPDVICIVESWLSTEIHDTEVAICGYQSYRLDRNRHGGGVIVYVRSCFVTTLLPVPSHGLEIISLTVSNGIGKVCISVFYRPPSSRSLIFEDLFLYLQSLNIPEFCNYILLGDFNVSFCNYTHPFYRKLLNIFNSFGLSQVVSEPTHLCSNGSSSLIDLIAVSSPSLFQSCKTIPPLSSSDHLGLSFESQWKHASQPQSHPKRMVWRYAHADWQMANNLIEETDWQSLITGEVDTSWNNWQNRLLEIMRECVPHRRLPPRHNLPSLSKSLVQLMRRRNMLFSRSKRSKKKSDFERYKKLRNRVTTQLRGAKTSFFQINPRDTKKLWKSVKYLNKNQSSIPVLSQGNTLACTDSEKADMLGNYFSSCFNQAVPPLTLKDHSMYGVVPCNNLTHQKCSVDEIYHSLSTLDTSKATGPDKISAHMLKATASAIAPSVTVLMNLSLQTGTVPTERKKSLIVPIPKSSTPTTPNDYRPISLLSILSKVLERHVHHIISDHLHIMHPLSNSQWGFQPGKSTVTALLATVDNWLRMLDEGSCLF